nr:MgtC/SapB family protein [Pseudaminobacter soli]
MVGGLIGLERTFRGRPAGFRTHALVSIASAMLMLVAVSQGEWMTGVPAEAIRTDPTRMAQGIMTGIGFLGAGVILKEGATVRGLTTSASIWVTAALGILIGIGSYVPAVVGTVATVLVLSAFRIVEAWLPSPIYAHHTITFARDAVLPEEEVRKLVGQHGFSVESLAHRLGGESRSFEYRMVIQGRDRGGVERLSQHLRKLPEVKEFRIAPIGG